MDHYQITQEDIDATIRYMRAFFPDNPERALPEYCLAFLESLQARVQSGFSELSKDPAKFEEQVSVFEASIKEQSA
jgi:hypothetical protein